MAALRQAALDKHYLLIFFYKADDQHTRAMRKVFDTFSAKVVEKANAVAVDVNNTSEKPIVTRFGAAAAPMPIVLAVAPNGAITRGFPGKFEEKDLAAAFVTPATEKVLKAVQGRKLVILSLQNANTKSNEAAGKGIAEFKADKRFADATEIIHADPADEAEASFMSQLQVSPKTEQATTLLVSPSGTVIRTFKGGVTKNELVSAVTAASSGCGPGGCGPGGCK